MTELVWIEGAGNRFALIDAVGTPAPEDPSALARELASDVDGLLVLDRGSEPALRMVIYNADGTRPKASGNGLRCLAHYAADAGHAPRGRTFTIETDAGLRQAYVEPGGSTRVSMGRGRRVGVHAIEYSGERLEGIECDLGNPHLVLRREALTDDEVEGLGPRLQRDPRFPGGINVEFAAGEGCRFQARVWERGVGETAACGTGACAIAIALAERLPVEVQLPGGTLVVDRSEGELWLAGPVDR